MDALIGNLPSPAVGEVQFLLDRFAEQLQVPHALVVAADGLLMAATPTLAVENAERLSAIIAGLSSLAQGATEQLGGGQVEMTMIEMAAGYLLVMTVSDGSRLAVLAPAEADIGAVSFEMQRLVDRVGEVALTPQARHE
jgi:uncharacterized protein